MTSKRKAEIALKADSKQNKVDLEKSQDSAGTFLMCGNMDAPGKNLKKGEERNLWTPHQFKPLKSVRVGHIFAGCNACHGVIVTDKGKAMSWGRNKHGQLGLGDTVCRDKPVLIEALKDENIVAGSCGRRHTLLVTDRGQVYAFGDNKLGQCGVGNSQQLVHTPTLLKYQGPPITKVGCGGEFSVILDVKGALYSFGCPEYGQLGDNADGKYFVTNRQLGFHLVTYPKKIMIFVEKDLDAFVHPVAVNEIVDFSVGANHTVCVDNMKRVFSWGCGGYGRLGHAETKDMMIPTLIKFFEVSCVGVKSVHCGSTYSLAVNNTGVLYMFGQTNMRGEANMYPKSIQDLNGWNVRCVASGYTSIVLVADSSVIAWGHHPTYGELGFGKINKSSSVPKKVDALENLYITQIAAGLSYTMFIAQDKTTEERAKIARLPMYDPSV